MKMSKKEFSQLEARSLKGKKLALYYCSDEFLPYAQKLKVQLEDEYKLKLDIVQSSDKSAGVKAWVDKCWAAYDALLFISSCGIAVRAIASKLESKALDPAVLVLSPEKAHIIPLLSGHLGQASALADLLASCLQNCGNYQAIHSTQSDKKALIAADRWAAAAQLEVENTKDIVKINKAQLEAKTLGLAVSDELIEAPFDTSLLLRPKSLILGMGCKRGVSAEELYAFVKEEFKLWGLSLLSIKALVSHEIKKDEEGLIELAKKLKIPFYTYSEEELASLEHLAISHSDFVKERTGVSSVCELAALYHALKTDSSDEQATKLLLPKQLKTGKASLAVVREPQQELYSTYVQELQKEKRKLYIVGIGPGNKLDMTHRAYQVLTQAQALVAYKPYAQLISEYLSADCHIYTSGMKKEIDRVYQAIQLAAQGKRTVLVSSGDAGVYGMASLALELLQELEQIKSKDADIELEVVCGVSAAQSCSALLGAPLAHDFACISLSDLLTPWELIKKRLEACAESEMLIALYNPRSKGRPHLLKEALDIISRFRDPMHCYAAWVKNCGREGQEHHICRISELLDQDIDMLSTVIIGTMQTRKFKDLLFTPRGYHQKEDFKRLFQKKILLLGGTYEARKLCTQLLSPNIDAKIYYSSLTDYAHELLEEDLKTQELDCDDTDNLIHLSGALLYPDYLKLIADEGIDLIVDCTHPYASSITKTSKRVATEMNIPLMRFERRLCSLDASENLLYFETHEKLITYIKEHCSEEKIFLSTGAHSLALYTQHFDADKLWARILPVQRSLDLALEAKIKAEHLIAAQGPFSFEQNLEHFKQARCTLLVSKEGGEGLGFLEKIKAAQKLGMKIALISAPKSMTDMAQSQELLSQDALNLYKAYDDLDKLKEDLIAWIKGTYEARG